MQAQLKLLINKIDQRLRVPERLRRRPDFLRVQQRGLRARGRHMTIIVLANGLDVSRLGIVATRRLGGAVRRNRSKRLARELYRRHKARPGLDVVILPQPSFPDAAYSDLEADYRATLGRQTRRGR